MNTDDIILELKKEINQLLETKYFELKEEAEEIVKVTLESIKIKLENWTALLSTGELTPEEFEYLLKTEEQLLILKALQAKGIARLELKNFMQDLIGTIIQIVLKFI
ncbi:MAG: hypothetical protein QM535_03375 [Limnohabitans sp.]|nr:hypothetical protein [Limnohabitans sp.]